MKREQIAFDYKNQCIQHPYVMYFAAFLLREKLSTEHFFLYAQLNSLAFLVSVVLGALQTCNQIHNIT